MFLANASDSITPVSFQFINFCVSFNWAMSRTMSEAGIQWNTGPLSGIIATLAKFTKEKRTHTQVLIFLVFSYQMLNILSISFFFSFIGYFFLFTFQMLSLVQVSPPEVPYPIPPLSASIRLLLHPPTHPLLPHLPSIPLHLGIKPSQDQGPLLPLMPDNAILCYMCA